MSAKLAKLLLMKMVKEKNTFVYYNGCLYTMAEMLSVIKGREIESDEAAVFISQ